MLLIDGSMIEKEKEREMKRRKAQHMSGFEPTTFWSHGMYSTSVPQLLPSNVMWIRKFRKYWNWTYDLSLLAFPLANFCLHTKALWSFWQEQFRNAFAYLSSNICVYHDVNAKGLKLWHNGQLGCLITLMSWAQCQIPIAGSAIIGKLWNQN